MAFSSLSSRLNSLPDVLAGPILRRVTPQAVTVWLALSKSLDVTLLVRDADDIMDESHIIKRETAPSTKIGAHLHILAITCRLPEGQKLQPGQVYFYDLIFDNRAGLSKGISAALGGDRSVAYPPWKLPSFALPPTSLADLRLIHGSCRKPHGDGDDAMAILDDLIAASCTSANERPHQLLLTGDQIYADDVADTLLQPLTDAGDTLLSWIERFPTFPFPASTKASDLLPADRISLITEASFTTGDKQSHLISLGEYLAMYLFVWSDVVWPPDLPTTDDVVQSVTTKAGKKYVKQKKNVIENHRNRVLNFKNTIPKIRRALANIPTYMIFDDHEITDDWNMTHEFTEDVYSNSLGLRIVQNGLVAYALCQGWGNTPEQFESSDSTRSPGRQLLDLLSSGADYYSISDTLATIVGLVPESRLKQHSPYELFHDGGPMASVNGVMVDLKSLNYNYLVEGPAHNVLVMDTRTWRSYPRSGKVSSPDLIGYGDMIVQSSVAGMRDDRLLLVVVTTNMPPIPSIRQAERDFALTDGIIYDNDLYDSWKLPSLAFDRMVALLAGNMPKDSSNVYSGRAVLLSGDVHSSYASRLMYWATSRIVDNPASPTGAKVAFAHLVASALKNQSDKTIGQHEGGYDYVPHWYFRPLVDTAKPAGYVGWSSQSNIKVGTQIVTGSMDMIGTKDLIAGPDEPSFETSQLSKPVAFDTYIQKTPDFQYRADVLSIAASGQQPASPPQIGAVPAGASESDRKKAAEAYVRAAGAYRSYQSTRGAGREIVGYNNIAEITFTWNSGDDKQVHHTVRWRQKGDTNVRWARYSVSLSLNDPHYPALPYPT